MVFIWSVTPTLKLILGSQHTLQSTSKEVVISGPIKQGEEGR